MDTIINKGRRLLQAIPKSADPPSSEKDIVHCMKPFTCEWLIQLRLAFSDMVQTLLENVEVLQNYEGTILTP